MNLAKNLVLQVDALTLQPQNLTLAKPQHLFQNHHQDEFPRHLVCERVDILELGDDILVAVFDPVRHQCARVRQQSWHGQQFPMPARYDGIIVQSVGGFACPIALVCPMLTTEFFHHWRTIAEVMSTSEKRRSNRGDGWSASRVLLLGSLANALAIEFLELYTQSQEKSMK